MKPFIWKNFFNAFRVVAVDLRGFSLSDKPFGIENYRKDKIAEDIKQLIEALGKKTDQYFPFEKKWANERW